MINLLHPILLQVLFNNIKLITLKINTMIKLFIAEILNIYN